MSLLDVEELSVRFDTDDGPVHAVDELSFTLGDGEVLGVVGESGCGKSVSFMSLLRLLPRDGDVSTARRASTASTCSRPRTRGCARSAGARSRSCSRSR